MSVMFGKVLDNCILEKPLCKYEVAFQKRLQCPKKE